MCPSRVPQGMPELASNVFYEERVLDLSCCCRLCLQVRCIKSVGARLLYKMKILLFTVMLDASIN